MGTNPNQERLEQEGYDFAATCSEIHNEPSHGFLEEVHQENPKIEFSVL